MLQKHIKQNKKHKNQKKKTLTKSAISLKKQTLQEKKHTKHAVCLQYCNNMTPQMQKHDHLQCCKKKNTKQNQKHKNKKTQGQNRWAKIPAIGASRRARRRLQPSWSMREVAGTCANVARVVQLARSAFGKKQKRMSSPGFEPRTFSVLDWRDNQLHHEDHLLGCESHTKRLYPVHRTGWISLLTGVLWRRCPLTDFWANKRTDSTVGRRPE